MTSFDSPVPNVYDIPEAPFSLFDDLPQTEEVSTSLQRSTHLQETDVSRMFFGRANVERLQKRLRYEIKKRTGYVIDRQSDEQLMIVMRFVYVMASRNAGGGEEVERLNELVMREVVPQVGAGLEQYLGYLRDASTLPTPIDRAEATSVRGTKSLEMFRQL